MQRRVSQHEVGADPARIRAIQKRLDVRGCDMLTALAEAVRQRFKTDVVAVATVFDAFLHIHLSYSCFLVAELPLDRSAAKKPGPPPFCPWTGRSVPSGSVLKTRRHSEWFHRYPPTPERTEMTDVHAVGELHSVRRAPQTGLCEIFRDRANAFAR